MNVLAGVVWHFWIGAVLVPMAVLLLVATVVGYFMKVSRTRYPK